MGLAFLFCMLLRVNGNSKVSNGLLGQHRNVFLEQYKEKIQTYMMTGGEIGWQHCDLLTANNYQDKAIPQIIMDLDQMQKLNAKFIFSTSQCLLITYHVKSADDLSNLIEFGWKTVQHVRLALVITMDSGINLEIAKNSTNLPFLVAVQFADGEEKFICPVVGKNKLRLEPYMCKQSYTSYKDKAIKIGILGIEPYLVPTKSGIDGTDVRLLKMLSERLHFKPQIVIPSSMLDAEELVGINGMFSTFCR